MKSWSLNAKIASVIGLLSFAFIACSLYSVNTAMKNRQTLRDVTNIYNKRLSYLIDVRDTQRVMMISLFEMMSREEPEVIAKNTKRFDQAIVDVKESLHNYEMIASEKGQELAKKYGAAFSEYVEIATEAKGYAVKNEDKAAAATIARADKIRASMLEYMTEATDLTAANLKRATDAAEAESTQSILLNSVLSSSSIFLSLLIAFFVLRSLSRSIQAVVSGLSDSAEQVSAAATQIASASEELSQAATEQAASLEETAAPVEEMNSMVGKNSENATSTAETSDSSRKKAELGKQTVVRMTEAMREIADSNTAIMTQVNASNNSMSEIISVIEQIDKKTKVINEIVNKTELLSFNASVEAARAGEHGKGFAVVAEEVGNLARISGSAAEEISALLEQSIVKVNHVVQETKSSVGKLIEEGRSTIESGTDVARECGDAFETVLVDVTSVSGMANEISSASQEQSRGISEITKAMSQLDQMTQQNAATSEECASSAEELSQQAEALKAAVRRLILTVDGDKSGAANSTPAFVPQARAGFVPTQPSNGAQPSRVVHLKSNKKPKAASAATLKRASGDTPSYDSSGFTDI